ncbi:hypothetical protein SynA15127_02581 [Synechococcus sp. A15-127]|nr:hypothetical protein SynA15127_02581 [Synechococcus sp. A15-127]
MHQTGRRTSASERERTQPERRPHAPMIARQKNTDITTAAIDHVWW